MTSRLLFILLVVTPFLQACESSKSEIPVEEYETEIMQWRNERVDVLKADNGYLSLIGLFWLEQGANTVGSDSTNNIVFPDGKSPANIGTYYWLGDTVRLIVNEEAEIKIEDSLVNTVLFYKGHLPVLNYGSLAWYLIKRGDKVAIRLRDYEAEMRKSFPGFDYYPIDQKWRIEAEFEPYDPPMTFYVKNILGMDVEYKSPGKLRFKVDGKEFTLDIFDELGKNFLIIADETSGNGTYGSGRFFYVDDPDDNNKTLIDFNKAYNPPCAYNDFTTCPLPPPQNYLAISITAGEKDYVKH